MPTPANERLQTADAPGGLAQVQEFLNTVESGPADARRPDLLADGAAATAWASEVWGSDGSAPESIDDAGADRLRALRDDLRGTIAARDGGEALVGNFSTEVRLIVGPAGDIVISESPDDHIAGVVLAETLTAQTRGEWDRIKICALDLCGSAFYDRSRNGSARYHSPRCANYVNLRASRARHRTDQH